MCKLVCSECGEMVEDREEFDLNLELCMECSIQWSKDNNCSGEFVEKFECDCCGVYFWVEDRDDFECPNCEAMGYNCD